MSNQQTKLTRNQKNAYRYLLYNAMLDIRMYCQSRGTKSRNPLEWRRQYRQSHVAGSLADWLHNLARYSSTNFKHFDEEHFWREYDSMNERLKAAGLCDDLQYRERFESAQKYVSEDK